MSTITNVNEKGYFENTVRPKFNVLNSLIKMKGRERTDYLCEMKYDDVDELIDVIDFLLDKIDHPVVNKLTEIRKDAVFVNSNDYRTYKGWNVLYDYTSDYLYK